MTYKLNENNHCIVAPSTNAADGLCQSRDMLFIHYITNMDFLHQKMRRDVANFDGSLCPFTQRINSILNEYCQFLVKSPVSALPRPIASSQYNYKQCHMINLWRSAHLVCPSVGFNVSSVTSSSRLSMEMMANRSWSAVLACILASSWPTSIPQTSSDSSLNSGAVSISFGS